MKKDTKSFLVIIAVGVGIILIMLAVPFIMMEMAFGGLEETYTTADLVKNYDIKRKEIYEVKTYFNSIVPPKKTVEIEFKSNSEIGRWGIYPNKPGNPDMKTEFLDWNLEINSAKTDSLLKVLGWTHATLDKLKHKLDAANCIAVQSGEITRIGFQRSGMGMYFYNVFDKPIPDSLKNRFNDSCTYIYANPNLVLEYGGGAFGPQCFPKEHK